MKIVGLRTRKKEREEKSKERCLVSKQQLTLGAARAAGWVPVFLSSSPHSLPEEFDLPDLTEYVWIYFPSDTQL